MTIKYNFFCFKIGCKKAETAFTLNTFHICPWPQQHKHGVGYAWWQSELAFYLLSGPQTGASQIQPGPMEWEGGDVAQHHTGVVQPQTGPTGARRLDPALQEWGEGSLSCPNLVSWGPNPALIQPREGSWGLGRWRDLAPTCYMQLGNLAAGKGDHIYSHCSPADKFPDSWGSPWARYLWLRRLHLVYKLEVEHPCTRAVVLNLQPKNQCPLTPCHHHAPVVFLSLSDY